MEKIMTDKPDFEKLRREATPVPFRWLCLWPVDDEIDELCINRETKDEEFDYQTALNSGFTMYPMYSESQMRDAIDARIAAEARVAKLEKKLSVAVDTLSAGFRDGGITEDHCFNTIQKIKEIDNEE